MRRVDNELTEKARVGSQGRHENHEIRDRGTEEGPVLQEPEGEELDPGEESLPDGETGESHDAHHNHTNNFTALP